MDPTEVGHLCTSPPCPWRLRRVRCRSSSTPRQLDIAQVPVPLGAAFGPCRAASGVSIRDQADVRISDLLTLLFMPVRRGSVPENGSAMRGIDVFPGPVDLFAPDFEEEVVHLVHHIATHQGRRRFSLYGYPVAFGGHAGDRDLESVGYGSAKASHVLEKLALAHVTSHGKRSRVRHHGP